MEGTAIHSQLKRHSANKTVYIDGFACSITAVIAMCGDKVVMPANCMMMIHNVWWITAGNPAELRKSADDLEVICKSNRQAFLEKANGKIMENKLVKLLDAETWLTADECLQYGFCDEITSSRQDLSQKKQQLKSFFSGRPAALVKAPAASSEQQREKFILMLKALTPNEIVKTAVKNQSI